MHRTLELARLACHLPELATLYRRETELPSLTVRDVLRAAARYRLRTPPSPSLAPSDKSGSNTDSSIGDHTNSSTSDALFARIETLVYSAFNSSLPPPLVSSSSAPAALSEFSTLDADRSTSLGAPLMDTSSSSASTLYLPYAAALASIVAPAATSATGAAVVSDSVTAATAASTAVVTTKSKKRKQKQPQLDPVVAPASAATSSTASSTTADRHAQQVARAAASVEHSLARVETPYKIYIENLPLDATEVCVAMRCRFFFFFGFRFPWPRRTCCRCL